MKQILKNEKVFLIILFTIITIAYLPTFSGEFILDDKPLVKNNPYIREFHTVFSYLSQQDGILQSESGKRHSGYYRPLVNLTYTLDLKIWGLNPVGFRATNFFLHLMVCFTLYMVLRSLNVSQSSLFLAVLIFGLHPANTESVSWIASRNNILATLFVLMSFYFYIKRVKDSKIWSGMLSLMGFALALLSKEFAVMLLPVLYLYDELIPNRRDPFTRRLLRYVPFMVIILCYLLLRRIVLDYPLPIRQSGHLWNALYFVPYLVLSNLRIIFLPFGLHNFILLYPKESLGIEAISGFIGICLIGFILWFKRKNKIMLFSVLSFFIALFPVLNIIPTSAVSLISMRWLYFPMVFLSFFMVWCISKIMEYRFHFHLMILCLLMAYLGSYSYILNDRLWKTEDRFFMNEVLLFGNHFYAGDLARMYQRAGEYQKSKQYYQTALKRSDRSDLFIDYGALLVNRGEYEEALSYLDKAESFDLPPEERGALYNNKGAAYFRLRDYEDAIKALKKAVILAPAEMSYLVNLGSVYKESGRYGEAINIFRRCLALDRVNIPVLRKLAMSYVMNGNYSEAIRSLEAIPLEERENDPIVQDILIRAQQSK